ncbi:MAG: twin-arginine translocation signal domain-containing protein [Bryobacteraceae bacterium]
MKPTRRRFLAATAAAPATARTGRIDCQSHLFSSEFLDLLEKRIQSPYVYRNRNDRFVL